MSLLLNDDRITRRAAAGDQRALAAIFDRYRDRLYRFCLSILGDPQDAQDALQNTMVKVLRALPGERRRIELKPWLYRIAHNEAVELLRHRRPTVALDPELAVAGAGLAEEAAQRQRLALLIADLGHLPERQRGALVMRELGGLRFEQIAEALGTSPATARQAVYEARLGLREMESGREMSCLAVTKAISDGDRRVLRRREIRAHLRGCEECRRFGEEIAGRERTLAALSPLPALVAAAMLKSVLGSGGGGAAGLGAGLGSTAAGSAVGSGLLKGAATVAVVAVVGVTAAKQTGLVDAGAEGAGHGAAPTGQRDSRRPAAERPAAPVANDRAPATGVQASAPAAIQAVGGRVQPSLSVAGPGGSGSPAPDAPAPMGQAAGPAAPAAPVPAVAGGPETASPASPAEPGTRGEEASMRGHEASSHRHESLASSASGASEQHGKRAGAGTAAEHGQSPAASGNGAHQAAQDPAPSASGGATTAAAELPAKAVAGQERAASAKESAG